MEKRSLKFLLDRWRNIAFASITKEVNMVDRGMERAKLEMSSRQKGVKRLALGRAMALVTSLERTIMR